MDRPRGAHTVRAAGLVPSVLRELDRVAEFRGAAPRRDHAPFGPELHAPSPAQSADPTRLS